MGRAALTAIIARFPGVIYGYIAVKATTMQKIKNPVAHIGIIGGGQLGRMMAIAARRLGCAVSVIDPTPDSPAGQVADQQIVAAFDDHAAMRSLVEACDVTTFEIETIDVSDLIELEQAGHAIFPSPRLLAKLQVQMKGKAQELVQLEQDEQRLHKLVESLQQALRDIPPAVAESGHCMS